MTYMLTGKPKKAFDCLDVSLEIARKLGDNREQGIILKSVVDMPAGMEKRMQTHLWKQKPCGTCI